MLIGRKYIGTIGYMGGVLALPEPFVWSWSQMIEYNNDYLCEPTERIYYTRETRSYHSFARNNLAKNMRGDWILMLDTDHQFEPDIAARMLFKMNKYNLDVLSGLYRYRGSPFAPVAYRWTEDGKDIRIVAGWKGPKDGFLVKVDAVGAGCLMIRRKVFERISERLKQEPFDVIHPFSEDISFFQRLTKLKIPAYLDPNIEVNHLMYQPISSDMFKIDKHMVKYIKEDKVSK